MSFAIIERERAPGILGRRPAVESSAVLPYETAADFLRVLARQRANLGARPDFHHLPGRLRLRGDALNRDPAGLEAVRREFAAVAGVRSATANPFTGSILIDYDPAALAPAEVASALPEVRGPADEGAGLLGIIEFIGAKVMERLLEKLAVALIAAVV